VKQREASEPNSSRSFTRLPLPFFRMMTDRFDLLKQWLYHRQNPEVIFRSCEQLAALMESFREDFTRPLKEWLSAIVSSSEIAFRRWFSPTTHRDHVIKVIFRTRFRHFSRVISHKCRDIGPWFAIANYPVMTFETENDRRIFEWREASMRTRIART